MFGISVFRQYSCVDFHSRQCTFVGTSQINKHSSKNHDGLQVTAHIHFVNPKCSRVEDFAHKILRNLSWPPMFNRN